MNHTQLALRLPAFLRRQILHFEDMIEHAVAEFAGGLPDGARVLDAGAGECRYRPYFARYKYTGVDLGLGDPAWNYSSLDVIADLVLLPFRDNAFDACLNLVTLEHVADPAAVLRELNRTLRLGGRLLLAAPQEWEMHQQPYDYYRYTRYGLQLLLERAGFEVLSLQPAGGFFRLLSRRLLNALKFFPGFWMILAAPFLVPPALLLPLFDGLDRRKDFTLGYICLARKSSAAPPSSRWC